ncbi:ran guanine nucleotide release factor-like protein, partial [Trifolium medium]|nr:ran guanine nucleotide release factor-like protein [Trifolium medium]
MESFVFCQYTCNGLIILCVMCLWQLNGLIILEWFLLPTIASAKMSQDIFHQSPLFGGKLSTVFPNRFQDVSNIPEVPDHQEVFADPSRDESLIVELLEFKPDIAHNGSAT